MSYRTPVFITQQHGQVNLQTWSGLKYQEDFKRRIQRNFESFQQKGQYTKGQPMFSYPYSPGNENTLRWKPKELANHKKFPYKNSTNKLEPKAFLKFYIVDRNKIITKNSLTNNTPTSTTKKHPKIINTSPSRLRSPGSNFPRDVYATKNTMESDKQQWYNTIPHHKITPHNPMSNLSVTYSHY